MIRYEEEQIVDIRFKETIVDRVYHGEILIWSEIVVDFMLRAVADGGTIELSEAEIVAELNN